jgi:NADH-quinone oxidoreductase subunit H
MIDTGMVIEWIIKSLVLILGLTGGFAYLTWLERRLLARFQSRIGPNRAGPFGLGVPIADAVKAFLKEELIPHYADKVIFVLAPVITVVPALTVLAVIPWGEPLQMFGRQVSLYISDVNVGIVYIMAITSISVYGITLAGWSSNNKYALLGGLRDK